MDVAEFNTSMICKDCWTEDPKTGINTANFTYYFKTQDPKVTPAVLIQMSRINYKGIAKENEYTKRGLRVECNISQLVFFKSITIQMVDYGGIIKSGDYDVKCNIFAYPFPQIGMFAQN